MSTWNDQPPSGHTPHRGSFTPGSWQPLPDTGAYPDTYPDADPHGGYGQQGGSPPTQPIPTYGNGNGGAYPQGHPTQPVYGQPDRDRNGYDPNNQQGTNPQGYGLPYGGYGYDSPPQSGAAHAQQPRSSETELYLLRTHPKCLISPILVLIGTVAALTLFYMFTPATIARGAFGWILWILAAIGIIGWTIYPILAWRYATYRITDQRIQVKSGVIAKKSRDIPLSRVTEVSCDRGVIDRIFGCGTLVIKDAAATTGMRFTDIPHVLRVQEDLHDLVLRIHHRY